HSLRCTRQRMAVFEALRESHSHPTAEELYRIVRPGMEKLSLATVYNALEALCTAGLVQRMPMSNGCCRYDADTEWHLHVRFPETAEIEDLPAHLSEKLMKRLPDELLREVGDALGVRINGVSIHLLATRETEGSAIRDQGSAISTERP
ncbi:MAG: transcriptional repressor, partial [Planctomycetota bacterium]|nr:transcriptional repressor [Planctomycetota bacterium]